MRALILGVGGQDGSYLAEHLLSVGYEVHGLHRRSSVDNIARVRHIPALTLHRGDMMDSIALTKLIRDLAPDELYNLADQDHVGWSYETPRTSVDVTIGAVQTILETLRGTFISFFQPCSVTMFSGGHGACDLDTPLRPLSPYACAKAHAWHLCRMHREKYNTRVYVGILANHDSPRRSGDYLLHKMVRDGRVVCSDPDRLVEVGFAGDFARQMQFMLEYPSHDAMFSGPVLSMAEWAALAGCELVRGEYDQPEYPVTSRSRTTYRSSTSPSMLVDMLKEKYKCE